jgi:hypothetical protein
MAEWRHLRVLGAKGHMMTQNFDAPNASIPAIPFWQRQSGAPKEITSILR